MTTETLVLRDEAGESRILLREIGWDGNETILKLVGDRPVPRLAYLLGDLELISPGSLHESTADRTGHVVCELGMGLGVRFRTAGHTTLRRKAMGRGIEGDKAFYTVHARQVLDKTVIDLEFDPPPDLVIEVEISRPLADRLSILLGLAVPEVWVTDVDSLRFLGLRADGQGYDELASSRSFPGVTPADLLPWTHGRFGEDDFEFLGQLRTWVREVLGPRLRQVAL